MGSFNSNELEPQVHDSNLLLAQAVESKLQMHHDLFQQRAVGGLLPKAEHDSHGESGEHGGAPAAENVRIWGSKNKNFLPHKPRLLQL